MLNFSNNDILLVAAINNWQKSHLFLDLLSKVFHSSYKFQTLQWFFPAEGKSFIIFLGNTTFCRLLPPRTLSYLCLILVQMILMQQKQFTFTKNSSGRYKCIGEINFHRSIWKLYETKNTSEPAHWNSIFYSFIHFFKWAVMFFTSWKLPYFFIVKYCK